MFYSQKSEKDWAQVVQLNKPSPKYLQFKIYNKYIQSERNI